MDVFLQTIINCRILVLRNKAAISILIVPNFKQAMDCVHVEEHTT